jgi:cell wall-associated NlpC family hydrolase
MALLGTTPGLAHAAPAAPFEPPAASASLEQVRKQIEDLYRQAAAATDAYNLAEEEAKRQSDQIVATARRIVAGQARIAELKAQAGAAARAQYRSGGLPPAARLALANDPNRFLDGAGLLRKGEQATKGMLDELTRTQNDLELYARDAGVHWQSLEANRLKTEAAKQQVTAKIKAAEQLENRLEAEEKARMLQLEREAQYRAQKEWTDTGVLKKINGKATAAGARAVQYAVAQIGKPYVWGAEGPDSFDCSGLTSQAWLAGGKRIPRTSQEQLRLLPKVALKDMRPGDLIIYFDDASHVALYIGDGAMVHAPRPKRNVTIAGAGSMPIRAVVRPDA